MEQVSGKVREVSGRQWHNYDDIDTFGMVFNECKRNHKIYYILLLRTALRTVSNILVKNLFLISFKNSY